MEVRCNYCGKSFPYRGGYGYDSSEFCSPKCQMAYEKAKEDSSNRSSGGGKSYDPVAARAAESEEEAARLNWQAARMQKQASFYANTTAEERQKIRDREDRVREEGYKGLRNWFLGLLALSIFCFGLAGWFMGGKEFVGNLAERSQQKKLSKQAVALIKKGEYGRAYKKIKDISDKSIKADARDELESAFAKFAKEQVSEWYTADADIIVGKQFVGYDIDSESGKVSEESYVPFPKTGKSGSLSYYTVDVESRTVTNHGISGGEDVWHFFPDGSVIYGDMDGDKMGLPRKDAEFNARQATEVAGRTFSGKWSDKYSATVTFGRNGRASVRFNDGDTASGAYLASDADNVVLYNHGDKGLWMLFTYSDNNNSVTFHRLYAKKDSDGDYDLAIDTRDSWKKQ